MFKPFHRSTKLVLWLIVLATITGTSASSYGTHNMNPKDPKIVTEFIYETASFPSCHASTLAETPEGIVAAWFGGSDEGNNDVGIWFSRRLNEKWTPPVELANGIMADGKRYPCWNPVLFQVPNGALILYYKVGPNPKEWKGRKMISTDNGVTWSASEALPEGFLGPVKNKPILTKEGELLCPTSTEHDGWRLHLEKTNTAGKTWWKTQPLNDGKEFSAIQPSILTYPKGKMQLLCRSRNGWIVESWSTDGGKTWSPVAKTTLPNPNSGTDAVTLKDGKQVLVYNPVTRGRTPIAVAISRDGIQWKQVVTLEDAPGEYSYPAIIQASDGKIHISYTWKRERIRYHILDPKKLR